MRRGDSVRIPYRCASGPAFHRIPMQRRTSRTEGILPPSRGISWGQRLIALRDA